MPSLSLPVVLSCYFHFFERESIMSTSKVFHISPYAQLVRPALVAAALLIGVGAAQAADPAKDPAIQKEGSITSQKNHPDNESQVTSPNNPGDGTTANSAGGKAPSDGWITTKVKSELLANSASKGLKVHVTTKGGVVALKGKLPSQDAADLVKNIAQNVKGVQSVDVSGLTVDSSS